MNFFTAPLSALSLAAVAYTFYILANLSRRYGEVIRMPPYYRGFYVAMGLVAIALFSHLMQDMVISAPDQGPELLSQEWFHLLTYYLPLALAVTLSIGIAWRYWSWILKEHKG
jgi:uncharacterized membrane protein